jgi:hypothetical protein
MQLSLLQRSNAGWRTLAKRRQKEQEKLRMLREVAELFKTDSRRVVFEVLATRGIELRHEKSAARL